MARIVLSPIKRETVEARDRRRRKYAEQSVAQEQSKVCFIQIVNASRRRFSSGAASFIALRYTKKYKTI
jgi:hypothetical protein